MSRTTDFLICFLTGALTGAALGVLYAPEKGIHTRDKLAYQLEKYRKRLEMRLEEILQESRVPATSNARSEGEKVVKDARIKAEKLLEDVDELIGRIRQQK